MVLGEALSMAELYEEAVRVWKKASSMQPRNPQVRAGLQKAEAELKRSLSKDYYKILGISAHVQLVEKDRRGVWLTSRRGCVCVIVQACLRMLMSDPSSEHTASWHSSGTLTSTKGYVSCSKCARPGLPNTHTRLCNRMRTRRLQRRCSRMLLKPMKC